MASTGAPVVTEVTEVADGAAVAVEIAHVDTGVVTVTAVAAVEAGIGAVGVAEREVTAQRTWKIIAEDSATIKNGEAEALMAKTRPLNLPPTPLILQTRHPLKL